MQDLQNSQDQLGVSISRREFTVASALAMLAGVVITVSGCSSSSMPTSPSGTPTPTPTPGGSSNDVTGAISANHGHAATITRAQLTAANALELDIQGTATHPHTVSLSQGELGQIAVGTKVTKESTNNNGHSHSVTFK
jgi:hypothetical protein